MFYIVTEDTKDYILDNETDVSGLVVLDNLKPIEPVLIRYDIGDDFKIVPSPKWSNEQQNQWVENVESTIIALAVSKNTSKAYGAYWYQNTLNNLLSGKMTIDNNILNQFTGFQYFDSLVLIGGGPSRHKVNWDLIRSDKSTGTIACWSANDIDDFTPDYLAHIDHRKQMKSRNCNVARIFTNSAHPSFLQGGSSHGFISYIDQDNPAAWPLIDNGFPSNTRIMGCVNAFLINMALYSRCKRILLSGFDFSFPTIRDLIEYEASSKPMEAINYKSEIVYTNQVLSSYHGATNSLILNHPEIDWFSINADSMEMTGVEYLEGYEMC